MISHLKKIFRHTAIFSFSSILSKGIGLLLLPLYTRYLSPADYGILELLALMLQISILLCVQGIPPAFFQSYTFEFKDDETLKEKALGTALFYMIVSVGVYCGIFYVLADNINDIIFESNKYSDLLRVMALTCFLQCITFVPNGLLRAELKSVTISVLGLIQLIANIFFNVYFITALNLGVRGIIFGNLIAALIYAITIYAVIAKKLSFSLSFKILKDMMSYGLPLVPAGLALFILNGSDRFFLQKFSTTHQLGLYSLGYKISTILQFVVIEPFILVWPSVFFPLAKERDAQVTFGRLTSVFFLFILFVGLFFILLSKPLIMIMAPEEFWDAQIVCIWLIPSVILYGLYHILNIGINIERLTKYTPAIIGIASLSNLLLNYLLIPAYGMSGAAVSTFISSAIMVVLAFYINNRIYPIAYQWGFLLKTSAFFWVSLIIASYIEGNSLLLQLARIFIVMSFFTGGLFISSVLKKHDQIKMMELIFRIRATLSGDENN